MRILNWMFNKRSGLQETSRYDHITSSLTCNAHREEFSHWPESLFSIGTFGTYDLKETKQKCFASYNKTVEQDLSDLTSEDVATLVKKLEIMGVEREDLIAEDEFVDCSTSIPDPICENYRNISNQGEIVFSKGKDLDDTTSMLKKRSISFSIKKVFAFHGGFAPVPAPELRDVFYQSRMKKLFKSILRKKIYPQNGTAMPMNKYLHRKHQEMLSIEEEAQEKVEDGGKWVKTDSEYSVCEDFPRGSMRIEEYISSLPPPPPPKEKKNTERKEGKKKREEHQTMKSLQGFSVTTLCLDPITWQRLFTIPVVSRLM